MLDSLPEDMRTEILSEFQGQYDIWRAVNFKTEPEMKSSLMNEEPEISGQNDLSPDDQAAQLGMDPEVLASLPQEMRDELIANARKEQE